MNCRSVFSLSVRLVSHSSCLRSKGPAAGSVSKKALKLEANIKVPVENDTKKLATHVCGTNLFTEGEDIKLKPDSEYPEWLWKMRSPPKLEDLDKNSKTYWNRIRRHAEKEIKYLKTLDKLSKVHK